MIVGPGTCGDQKIVMIVGPGTYPYTTTRRTHEIGVRVAVGAGRAEIVRLVLAQGMRPVLAGAALGLAGAYAASRALRGLLFGVSPLDLPSLAGAAAIVLLVGAAALDPIAALRWE